MRMRWLVTGLLAVLTLTEFPGSIRLLTAQTDPPASVPLPNLPADRLGSFNEGRRRFLVTETVETGLGPVFNERSCVSCHSIPTTAGSGKSEVTFVTRFGRIGLQDSDRFGVQTPSMPFNALLTLGGPTIQRRSVAEDLPDCRLAGEVVPREANAVGPRQPSPLFGLGLIQAIPDTTILARADPTDANRDGIAGRPNTANGILGRFGWKASVATIADFVGLAMINEIGITNLLYPNELSPQGRPIPPGCKRTPDVEDADGARLIGITAYLTFLSAPARGPITDTVRRGESLFIKIGCAACHTPAMKTGSSSNPALNEVEVPLYSDLLTHYVGVPLDDRVPDGDVGGGRWRTPPLWGLRVRKFYLHDGRTSDLIQAIALHGGEGLIARDAFVALGAKEQADLIAFLQSL
jgi:CxxC motif-containing protein (DUF1111 family)